MKKTTAACGAGLFLAFAAVSPVLGNEQSSYGYNPYVSAVETLVSRFESALGHEATPQWCQEQNEKLAQAFDALLEEYQVDPDTTGIAFETLDGSLSYFYNADDEFLAASLYKLPLAVYYYDQVNDGKMKLDDTLPYTAGMYEEGSVIAADYLAGSQIPLDELLEALIVYSDNTAGHILFENLGGWQPFRQAIRVYSPQASDSEEFVSMDNVISCRYMNDLLRRIAQHPDKYEKLIDDMLRSQPENYLNAQLETSIPQKYGAFGAQVNGAGFSLAAAHPYVVTVMSSDYGAEVLVGDVSALAARAAQGDDPQQSSSLILSEDEAQIEAGPTE